MPPVCDCNPIRQRYWFERPGVAGSNPASRTMSFKKYGEDYGPGIGPYGEIYGKGGPCPKGGVCEYTYEPSLCFRNNHGECWKCGDSPGLRWFNEQCNENIRNDECSICGGPRGHYGECK